MTSLSEQYVIVTEDENEQPMELPAEPDGTLLLTTLAGQFSGACGLKYYNRETDSTRGIRLADGRLHPPDGVWGNRLYVVVFPKGAGSSHGQVVIQSSRHKRGLYKASTGGPC